MAKEPRKPRGRTDPPPPPGKDPGSDTSAHARLVNAHESEPGFFKDPLIGQTLGKCKITKLLGEGKTAIVYQAFYKPLRRTVAVKVLQEHMKRVPAVLRVFQQEGRAVAALDHENVLKIYDVGEDKGQHYLVLEFLHGRNLLQKIDEAGGQGLPVEEALEYVRQAAAGLAAAHRKNLIHRDIKPQNLVVEPDGLLKIVDFGLAAEAEGAFAGGRLGTPHYMSPEQCRGENARTASDVYALGITLYHMLVGHPPYSGRPTTEEIVEEHLKGNRLEPEKLRRGLPPKVGDLVRRMTRMDPEQRPAATEILDLIAKLEPGRLSQRTSRQAVKSATRRLAIGRKGQPLLLGAGAVLLLGIVAIFAMGGGEEEEPPPATPPATVKAEPAPAKKAEPKPTVPKSLEDELKQLLAEARREEKTGNFEQAHYLYSQVLLKAPAGSQYATEAEAAARTVKELVNAERGKTRIDRKSIITVSQSQAAGKEYEAKTAEFLERLKRFEGTAVREELTALRDRTREGTPERVAIEKGLVRAGYVEGLVGLLDRASTLAGGSREWTRYDLTGEPLEIVEAGPEALVLKDIDTGEPRRVQWAALRPQVVVNLFDALRNAKSAAETLWVAYLCQLLGDNRAGQYFEYALLLDSGESMRTQVQALRDE
jgi:serine/threonine-protein kinase